MRIGRGIRWENSFAEEISFSKKNGFELIQIWFYKGELNIQADNKIEAIRSAEHPVIIHAVLTANEIMVHLDELIEILKSLNHNELIIHPVMPGERNATSLTEMSDALNYAVEQLKAHDIGLFVENNSCIDDINHRLDDMRVIYKHPDIHLLLDVAHIISEEHLEEILKICYPKKLHVADKHYDVDHEHLPLGEGEMDYQKIFNSYLKDFDGDIILEISESDEKIIDSYNKIREII